MTEPFVPKSDLSATSGHIAYMRQISDVIVIIPDGWTNQSDVCLHECMWYVWYGVCLCVQQSHSNYHLHLSRSLVDRWGDTDDLATSSLHSSRLSAVLMAAYSVMPVHSGMLSPRLFFCLPLLLPPCTVPCRIVVASPADLVTCPYHFNLRLFTVVKMSSWGPMACRILFRTCSFEMWSL